MQRFISAMLASRRRQILVGIALLSVGLIAFAAVLPVDAERFSYRSMYINSARASDTTYYEVSLDYYNSNPVGSLRMEFCDNPIPSLPCNVPAGMDVSGAVLSSQIGSTTGFSIDAGATTTNFLLLTRSPSNPGAGITTYRFDNMVNPAGETQDFYIRITSHGSTDGTGPIIDFGSVANQITPELGLVTQVPPVIIFCVAEQINDNDCSDLVGNYRDFGELDPSQTYAASSEILLYTNAQNGASITVVGNTITSGIKEIPAIGAAPTPSFVGVSQFGMNLAVNTSPPIGAAPSGVGTNLILNPTYTTPDQFLYNEGDVIASSSEVTLRRKFTASYILNVSADQAPGVYSTTISYICLAGF